MIGPAVGAAVIASAGIAWCFALNAASYLAVLASLFLIRLPPWEPAAAHASPSRACWKGCATCEGRQP